MAQFTRTVSELVDTALARIRSAVGTSATLHATALDFFNDSMQELLLAADWRWAKQEQTVVTVAGTRSVSLAADTLKVRVVNVTANGEERSLDLMEEDEARMLYPNPTDEGAPAAYISGVYDTSTTSVPPIKTIDILPTPDAVYSLRVVDTRGIKGYTTSDMTEVPPIPQYLYPGIIQLVAWHMLEFTSAPNRQVERAGQRAILFISQAKVFDRDLNKAPRAIRLTTATNRYRSQRYLK